MPAKTLKPVSSVTTDPAAPLPRAVPQKRLRSTLVNMKEPVGRLSAHSFGKKWLRPVIFRIAQHIAALYQFETDCGQGFLEVVIFQPMQAVTTAHGL